MAAGECVDGEYSISLYNPSGAGDGYSFNGGNYGGASSTGLPTTNDGSFRMPINQAATYTYYAVDQHLQAIETPSSLTVTQAELDTCQAPPSPSPPAGPVTFDIAGVPLDTPTDTLNVAIVDSLASGSFTTLGLDDVDSSVCDNVFCATVTPPQAGGRRLSALDPAALADAIVSYVNSADFASSLESGLSLPSGSVVVQNAQVTTPPESSAVGSTTATVHVEAGGNVVVKAGGVLQIG